MKEYISKPGNLSRIEFWAVTTIYVFSVFFMITNIVRNDPGNIWTDNRWQFDEAKVQFDYYKHYFFPSLIRYTLFYLVFLLFNYIIVPALAAKKAVTQNIFLIVFTFLTLGFVLGITDTYLKSYLFFTYENQDQAYRTVFQSSFIYTSWLMLMFSFYSAIKHAGLHLLANSGNIESEYQIFTRDDIMAFVLWMISLFVVLIIDAPSPFIIGWVIVIPYALVLHRYSFISLFRLALKKKNPFIAYLGYILVFLILSALPLTLLGFLLMHDGKMVAAVLLFNAAFQLLITGPITWAVYKRQLKGKQEVYQLKTELGQSSASFDFLRSQINPHFLFNALNTIYGTALQEKAERTSEGIEKLGDMMRFMLQENMQEKISLTREVDYLNNYISLQRLRTDTSPEVKIQAEIESHVNNLQISPMLLIPFVENAFKHGISLQEPSHIKVTLQTREKALYFDVHNSIRPKNENDPEKNESGIGLSNVKQRLQLLYPGKHELIIGDTGKEYFVHLTLQLA